MSSYRGSVVLRFRGETLVPAEVTERIGFAPHSASERFDPLAVGDRADPETPIQLNLLRPTGSWQRWPPAEVEKHGLEAQIDYWLAKLEERAAAVSELADRNIEPCLSCLVSTETVAAFRLDAARSRRAAALGLCLDFSVYGALSEPAGS